MERRSIEVRGIVQGVGFRPFVYGLASRYSLAGFVQNRLGSVHIELEGEPSALAAFCDDLTHRPPPLARIDEVRSRPIAVRRQSGFQITPSASSAGQVVIAPDVATCDRCLTEMQTPGKRRYRHPFVNCTDCGPRLTIVTGAPYDRPQTTMRDFVMCDECRAEYDDPSNRRFHAEAICCPRCGPSLQFLNARGSAIETDDPIAAFASRIAGGAIGALKGLGGFHLVCDATSDAAVRTLRSRKHRDEKPLAIMLADVESVERLCFVGDAERRSLLSSQRPIVLLRKRPQSSNGNGATLSPAIAPARDTLGVMLPYTPIHHLLMEATGGRPLVMTSGNQSDEPIAYRDDDFVEQLSGIADCYLTHDRRIHVRCDDSVVRVIDHSPVFVRRSRGYVPAPLHLPLKCSEPTLAVGGQLKASFALGRRNEAIVSHHLGDLDHYEALLAFNRDVALYERTFAFAPRVLAHDLHPDYASTRWAEQRANDDGLQLVAVQHHHAHLASCLVDNASLEPAIGVIFDGTGYGADGAVWGGEFLIGDCNGFERAAHLRYVAMPGGDQAIREPWRMAIAHLRDADRDPTIAAAAAPPAAVRIVERMIDRGTNAPRTSSMGRLFDSIAAVLGRCTHATYEGQAAMALESLAVPVTDEGVYPLALQAPPSAGPIVIDTRPWVQGVVDDIRRGTEPAAVARRFHSTVVAIVVAVSKQLRERTGLNRVALSGGVFLNAILATALPMRLRESGFEVLTHRRVSPGDGGLCLGQLAVAAMQTNRAPVESTATLGA
jgi:hydrogenase maturation protein HypF